MYPFPPAQELQRFAGDVIAQIAMSPYTVQLVFESECQIMAAQRIEHVEPDGRLWSYDCQAKEGAPVIFHRLLNRPIIAVEREDLRLNLRFNNGSALAVLSELGPYESGNITTPEGAFIVF